MVWRKFSWAQGSSLSGAETGGTADGCIARTRPTSSRGNAQMAYLVIILIAAVQMLGGRVKSRGSEDMRDPRSDM